jgi:hypothetical protein
MTNEKYQYTQSQLAYLCASVCTLDLAGFLERISIADSVGPVLDPTLYRAGMARMHGMQRIAQAAQAFQQEVRNVFEDSSLDLEPLRQLSEALSDRTPG